MKYLILFVLAPQELSNLVPCIRNNLITDIRYILFYLFLAQQELPELLPCKPNYMRCPQEEACIPVNKFCDTVNDCQRHHGDEGDFCKQSKY